MAPTSKVELYAAIHRKASAGSARAIERKHSVGRRTIVKALPSAWSQPRKKPPPRASRLDPYKRVIDAILLADLDAARDFVLWLRTAQNRAGDRCRGDHLSGDR
jgi:hypothetical protein